MPINRKRFCQAVAIRPACSACGGLGDSDLLSADHNAAPHVGLFWAKALSAQLRSRAWATTGLGGGSSCRPQSDPVGQPLRNSELRGAGPGGALQTAQTLP